MWRECSLGRFAGERVGGYEWFRNPNSLWTYILGKIVAFMKTPERTTAEVFPRYLGGEVVADSAALKWPGLFVRRYRFPRVVDGFLVPATAEPLIACIIAGSAEFQEREIGGACRPSAAGYASSRVQFEGGFSRPLISDIQPKIEKGDPFSHPSGSTSGPRVGFQSAF